MENTHLFLVRHGQSEGNAALQFGGHSDTPLSLLGRRQAEATARYLVQRKVSVIYSSDLPRTRQTAEFLADLTGFDVHETTAFRERDVGLLSGMTFVDAETKFAEHYGALVNRDFDAVMPGGESYRQMLVRATQELDDLLSRYAGERIAVFSHTGTICLLILHLLGALDHEPPRSVWIATRNCGIAHFEFSNHTIPRLHVVNDTRHLDNLR